jgi:hypothetical protein|tara:strand:+ start:4 stop:318 length:315 start_codon:yes stop_codon:yes gene_type:complete
MSFAKIDSNNIVTDIIIADQDFIDSLEDASSWVKYSLTGEFRKNPATIGGSYDSVRDAFIPAKIFPSCIFVEETCDWKPLVPKPTVEGVVYMWDEDNTEWKENE